MVNEFSITAIAEPEAATSGTNVLAAIFGLLLLTGLAAGAYAFVVGHEHAYNNIREVPWGLLISTYAFFAITSTGLCLLAAISHIFGGNRLAPLANRMVWLSLVTIISAFLVIGMEIENPWRMAIYNVISPNLTSNIWWMGTLYGMAVGFMLIEFWLILTKKYKLALVLGIFGALTEVGANTCLGGVFATLPSRPYWYGAQLPVYFLACAFLSGSAATVIFTHYSCAIRRKCMNSSVYDGMQSAGKVMLLMLVLVSVATFWKTISYFVGGSNAGRTAAEALVSGPLSTNFWGFEVAIGLVAPILLLVLTRIKSIAAMSCAGLLVLVGMFFARYDMVVAGQIVPEFPGFSGMPTYFHYVPSAAELLVAFAGIGLCGLAFLMGERFFGRVFTAHGEH